MEDYIYKIGETVTFTMSDEDENPVSKNGIIEAAYKADKGIIYYDIKSAGEIIKNVPEISIEHYYSGTQKEVDELLRKKELNKVYKDSDIRVGGTRKEMMAYKSLITVSDLSDIERDNITARALIKKDRVYPKVNIEEEINTGTSGGALYLKMKLRESCGNNPPNTQEARLIYTGLIDYITTKLSEVKTLNQFDNFRLDLNRNGVTTLIAISRPDLVEQIEKERAEYIEIANSSDEYRKLMHEANYKLSQKHGNTWHWKKEELLQIDEDKPIVESYYHWKNMGEKAYDFTSNGILPTEASFLKEINPKIKIVSYLSKSVFFSQVIDEIFGTRFKNFLSKSGKSEQIYIEANQYDPFTQEEYDSIYITRIKPVEEDIVNYKERIEVISDTSKPYKEIINYVLENTGIKTVYFTHRRDWGYKGKVNLQRLIDAGDINHAMEFIKHMAYKSERSWEKMLDSREKYLESLKEQYKVRDNDYSFAGHKKNRKTGERSELTVNSGEPLSYIKRTGGVAIFEDDLSDGDKVLSFYKDKLGMTGITYGISMPDKERSAHAKHFAGALLDLSEILNWDVREFTGLGDIKIKFGASGKGKANAHYESDRIAINLTRGRGDGSLCHELAHYIDNVIARRFSHAKATVSGHSVFSSYYIADAGLFDSNVSNEKISKAFQAVSQFIIRGAVIKNYQYTYPYLTSDQIEQLKPLLELYQQELLSKEIIVEVLPHPEKKYTINGKDNFDDAMAHYKSQYPHHFNYTNYKTTKQVRDNISALLTGYGINRYEIKLDNDWNNLKSLSYRGFNIGTIYYANCEKMKSKYWTFHWELFARAFETYISQKLLDNGRENNYLVSGAFFDRPEGVYPVGAERDILFVLFDNLFSTIKSEMNISDFNPFRKERSDEYIVLGENDIEKSGVVTDANTDDTLEIIEDGQVIDENDIDKEKIREFWLMLTEYLNEEKMEHGGDIEPMYKKLFKAV